MPATSGRARLTPPHRRAYYEAQHRLAHGGAASLGWRGNEELVEVWMDAMTLATEENVNPWDALLLAVKRRAARVRWADGIAETIIANHRRACAEDPDYAGDPDVPPATARVWLAESRNEERLMTRAAKMAVDAGVADAMIRRVEREGEMLTNAIFAALDSLDLTPDQRLTALNQMHQSLSARSLNPHDPRVIEPPPYE